MKKLEILWEWPKCNTETRSEQAPVGLLGEGGYLHFVQNTVSLKRNKAKHSKTRDAYRATAFTPFTKEYFCL